MEPRDAIDERNVEDSLEQSKEEHSLAMRVQELFRGAYDAKNQIGLNEKMRMFDDYKHGRQNPRQHEDHPGSVTNIIHPVIESQIADLTDKPYSVEVEGEEPADHIHSDDVKSAMNFILHKNKFRDKLVVSEHDRLELGTTIIKTFTDHDALYGKGLPTFEIVSPSNFFPDPKWSAYYRIQKCEFVIHAVPRPLSYIRKRYPETGKYVHREISFPYDPDQFKHQKSDEVSSETSQKAMLIECYMRDEEGEVYCIHVANHIVLEDSREFGKVQRRNKFPFVPIVCYPQRGIGWGQGDVELLIPTQDLINDLDDQIRINARLMGNPQIVVGQGAGRGFDIRKWGSKSGLRIPMRDHNAFNVVQAQSVSRDVPIRREKAFEEADRISGRADVTRGEAPGQVRAASAVIALQEAAQKTVIHKGKMLKEGWGEVLQLLYDEMIEHWDEEMWIKVQGDKPDYKFINPSALREVPQLIPGIDNNLIELTDITESLDDDGNPITRVDIDEDGEEFETPMMNEEVITREAKFDLRLSMGDGLPNDRAFIYQTLVDMANINIEGRSLVTWEELRRFIRNEIGVPLDSDDEVKQKQMQEQQMPISESPNMIPEILQGGMMP